MKDIRRKQNALSAIRASAGVPVARKLCAVGLSVLCLGLVGGGSAASAYVTVPDGISDQSMPLWDDGFASSYFHEFFATNWTSNIHYARYVAQWNAMTEVNQGKGNYREGYEAWVGDAASMGLTLDLSLTSYNGVYPSSKGAYKERLEELLNEAEALGHPIRYLEAWNEPNHQGDRSAATAAEYTNAGYVACEAAKAKCTIIAGNVEDSEGVQSYEEEYVRHLSPVPTNWGVHPYYSVENMNEGYYNNFVAGLPNEGTGDQIWITEIAVRRCTPSKENGEIGQGQRVAWLVDTLMKRHQEHVFYYEFLLGERKQPACSEFDDALYVPSTDPNAPDAPRPAQSFVFFGKDLPPAYTGSVSGVLSESATLTGSVYPGGALDARYHFEYGKTTSYGAYSAEGDAGPDLGRAEARATIGGLQANSVYHYRLVTWNSDGAIYGADKMFTTPSGTINLLTDASFANAPGRCGTPIGWSLLANGGTENACDYEELFEG